MKNLLVVVCSLFLMASCAHHSGKDCKGGSCDMKKKDCKTESCKLEKKEAKKSCCSKKKEA